VEVRLEVFTSVKIHVKVFWVVTPCSCVILPQHYTMSQSISRLEFRWQNFRHMTYDPVTKENPQVCEIYAEDGKRKVLLNDPILLQHYMASLHRKPPLEAQICWITLILMIYDRLFPIITSNYRKEKAILFEYTWQTLMTSKHWYKRLL